MVRRKIEQCMTEANARHYLYIIQMTLVDRKITLQKTLTNRLSECKQNHCKSLVNITNIVIS